MDEKMMDRIKIAVAVGCMVAAIDGSVESWPIIDKVDIVATHLVDSCSKSADAADRVQDMLKGNDEKIPPEWEEEDLNNYITAYHLPANYTELDYEDRISTYCNE
jgi:hypothetical protein